MRIRVIYQYSLAVLLLLGISNFVHGQMNSNVVKGLAAYNTLQNTEALKYFQAAGDDPDALVMLARMYYRGDGVPSNYATAKNYAEKAIAKGAGMGNVILYFIYDSGSKDIAANKELASQYLQKLLPSLNELRRSIIQEVERVYEVEVKDSNSLRMPEIEAKSFSNIRKDYVFHPNRRMWAKGVAIAAKDDGIVLNAPYIHMYAYLLQNKKIAADPVFTGLGLYELAHEVGYALSSNSIGDFYNGLRQYNLADEYYASAYERNYLQAFVSSVNNMIARNPDDYKIIDTLLYQISLQNEIMPACIGILVERMMGEKYMMDGKAVFQWAMLGYRNKSSACAYFLGKMFEEGVYVFQDIDKAIYYYEEASKLDPNSFGAIEAAKLKILTKKDAATSWALIKKAAAEGNQRALLYNVDLEKKEVAFNEAGIAGNLKGAADFYSYSPLYLNNNYRYEFRFEGNFQNNSGKSVYFFPRESWNIPFNGYAASPAMNAGGQKINTYILPYRPGSLFGKLTFAFRLKNSNGQYTTLSTVDYPMGILLLDSTQIANNKLNAARIQEAMIATPDVLVNWAKTGVDTRPYAKQVPRNDLGQAQKLSTYEVWSWGKTAIPNYFGLNDYGANNINRNDAQLKVFNGVYGYSLHRFHVMDVKDVFLVSFDDLLKYDDSLKLGVQRFIFTEKDYKDLQPFIQIKKTYSGKTKTGADFHHVSVGIRYGTASLINNTMYYNLVFLRSPSGIIYAMVASRRSDANDNSGENRIMTAAEEEALFKQARTMAETSVFY